MFEYKKISNVEKIFFEIIGTIISILSGTILLLSCDYIKSGKVINKEIIFEKYVIDKNIDEDSWTTKDLNGNETTQYDYEGTYFTEYFCPRNYKITVEGYSVKSENLKQESFYVSELNYNAFKIDDYIDVRNSKNKFIYSKWFIIYKPYKTNMVYIDELDVSEYKATEYFNNIILPNWINQRSEGKLK